MSVLSIQGVSFHIIMYFKLVFHESCRYDVDTGLFIVCIFYIFMGPTVGIYCVTVRLMHGVYLMYTLFNIWAVCFMRRWFGVQAVFEQSALACCQNAETVCTGLHSEYMVGRNANIHLNDSLWGKTWFIYQHIFKIGTIKLLPHK